MNPLRAGLEVAALGTTGAAAMLLGTNGAARVGRGLGAAWYRVDRGHRKLALANLRQAFPDLTEAERARIARECFRHFGSVMMDLLRFPAYGPQEVARRVRIDGEENLDAAVTHGRGVVFLTAHYGHWELGALALAYRGNRMELVTRPMDNAWLERRLTRARERAGSRVVHKRNAVRHLLRALREKRSVGLLIDQNFRDSGRVFVDFFGRPAATTPIAGILATRTGAAVLPALSWPDEDGRYRVHCFAPIHAAPSRDRARSALEVTRACTQVIEGQVRKRPELWLWMHDRWRTRPQEESVELQEARV